MSNEVLAEGKSVHEVESEGSIRQNLDSMDKNYIKGTMGKFAKQNKARRYQGNSIRKCSEYKEEG